MADISTSRRRVYGRPGNAREKCLRQAVTDLRREALFLRTPWVIVGIERRSNGPRGWTDGYGHAELLLAGCDEMDAVGAWLAGIGAEADCRDLCLLAASPGVDGGRLGF